MSASPLSSETRAREDKEILKYYKHYNNDVAIVITGNKCFWISADKSGNLNFYFVFQPHFILIVNTLPLDMCGFTSMTRKKGIIHYASLIVQCRKLLRPVFEKYHAVDIFTEADDFWYVSQQLVLLNSNARV